MNETRFHAEYTSKEPIPIEQARQRIANDLSMDARYIQIGWISSSVAEERDGTGALRSYSTEWTFIAQVSL